MRKAVVRDSDGHVENVVEHDPESDWSPPSGHSLIDADEDAEPGGTWDGSQFIPRDRSPPEWYEAQGVMSRQTQKLISEQYRVAGQNAIAAEQAIQANANIPQEVKDFSRAQIQMLYLLYVSLTGDRIPSVEDDYFLV